MRTIEVSLVFVLFVSLAQPLGIDINNTTYPDVPITEVDDSTTAVFTTTTDITTHPTTPNSTTASTTTTTTPSTTTTITTSTAIPTKTTPTSSSTTPTKATTALPPIPPPSNRKFDGPSFVGGIVLALGLVAIGFVAFKFYKARTELNYHTL